MNLKSNSFSQNWYGFHIDSGTAHSDTILEQGTMIILFQKTLCVFILVQMAIMCISGLRNKYSCFFMAQATTIYGNGGTDFIALNSDSSSSDYNNAYGGHRRYCVWMEAMIQCMETEEKVGYLLRIPGSYSDSYSGIQTRTLTRIQTRY